MPIKKANAHLFLPIIDAIANGKFIQVDAEGTGNWKDYEPTYGFTFGLLPEQYRVKPEPMCVLVFRKSGQVRWRSRHECDTRESLIRQFKASVDEPREWEYKIIEIPEETK